MKLRAKSSANANNVNNVSNGYAGKSEIKLNSEGNEIFEQLNASTM